MVLIWLMAILNIGLAQKDTRSGDAISDLDTGDWMGYIVLLGCKFIFAAQAMLFHCLCYFTSLSLSLITRIIQARMIMLSLKMTGVVPFSSVVSHITDWL